SAATLSPDGRTLATWRRDEAMNRSGVWLASPPDADAVPRAYTPAPFANKTWSVPVHLHFSPDGRQLLLTDWADAGNSAIWVLPFPDGASQPYRLFPKIPNDLQNNPPAQFAWMPDNERALMVVRAASTPQGGLWLTDIRTGAAAPISVGLTQQHNPSVSPDGSKVVFTSGGPSYDLVDVPLNGTPIRDFLATTSDEYSAAWVPESSRYVYLTNKNGEQELRIHSQAENWDRLIVGIHALAHGTSLDAPVASPDGQRVAYDVWGGSDGFASIWISPVGGGAPVKLTPQGAMESNAAWSPDGQSIACTHEVRGVLGLAVIHVGSAEPPRILVDHLPVAWSPAWSPDNKWIAYRVVSGVELVSPDGARHKVL